jgi:hypothetical protein
MKIAQNRSNGGAKNQGKWIKNDSQKSMQKQSGMPGAAREGRRVGRAPL